ncbi:fatty acid--CoA ligase family protein [Acidiferrimicrobium sp. IK]|uniref:class I adenylate-forming enzyme family protein n=1 Tax=Acidiferrimicrobium sp. IK TaxID=2871700 RepID=UPI0021CAF66B|nr:fatty acid--CoA ligase family protein [Acidiferrimicrobium sp. IK]MCU4183647.1 fatty acid--CoA ligase family protein [Acidiferrimicrobium sp. IK]
MPDLVALDLPGGADFVAALTQAWEEGDAVLPVDQRLAGPARDALFASLRPARVVGRSGTRPLPDPLPTSEGDALVMATSGTTGVPKGVVLTHDAVAASARATSDRLAVDPTRHRWLACLPLNHVGGLSVVTRALVTGTPVEVLAGFDAEEVIARSGPEVLVSLVSTTLARVGADRWRTVVLGGSAPPGGLPANVVTTYGMTETGSGVVYDGVPLDGVEVRVDDRTGEISLRGPMLLRAYRGPAGETDPLGAGGWLATGDAGSFGPDGRLRVDGRIGDMIITGGENVWPTPVEDVLRTHPGVREVAVAGRPDPDWGQRVVAWVVPDPGGPPALDDLRALVRDQLAGFAAPRQLVLVQSLPRTAIGKVQRDRLTIPDDQGPDPL